MALNFPASPTDGQIYTDTATGIQYKYISSFGYWSAVEPAINGVLQYLMESRFVGQSLTTGLAGDLEIPFNCTITQWGLLANNTGNVVVDVWKSSYANFPPVAANTITGSEKPTINNASKNTSTSLTGWSKSLNSGDILRFNIDSCDTIDRVTLTLRLTKV